MRRSPCGIAGIFHPPTKAHTLESLSCELMLAKTRSIRIVGLRECFASLNATSRNNQNLKFTVKPRVFTASPFTKKDEDGILV